MEEQFDWKTWCKMCGNPGYPIKIQYTPDIKKYLKINDECKICNFCSVKILEFQDLVTKSRKIDQMLRVLKKEDKLLLDKDKINEIRVKYQLEELQIKDEFLPQVKLEPKTECLDPEVEVELAVQDNLFTQFYNESDVDVGTQQISKGKLEIEFAELEGSPANSDFGEHPGNSESEVEDKKSKVYPTRKRPAIKYDELLSNKKKGKRTRRNDNNISDDDSDYMDDPEDQDYIDESEAESIQNEMERRERAERNEKLKNDRIQEESVIPLICHICEENFGGRGFSPLFKHCQAEHSCAPEVYCLCGGLVDSMVKFSGHRRRCVVRKFGIMIGRPYQCDHCAFCFKDKYTIDRHMYLIHSAQARQKNISCDICGKNFDRPNTLEKHKLVHIPKDQRERYPCPTCGKLLISEGSLRTHIRLLHDEKKDYVCHLCSMRFKRKHYLAYHVRRKHEETELPYTIQCELCQKMFRTNRDCEDHQKKVHAPNRFFCSYCPVGCKVESQLKKHIAIVHMKEGAGACDLCGKQFSNLKEHMRSVHSNQKRQYNCLFCSANFTKSGNY
jgi:hypothetical protein